MGPGIHQGRQEDWTKTRSYVERLEEAHRRGVRVAQLARCIRNDIGELQTGPVRHNGMTDFGANVIRELNRLGVLVDVAHATEPLVRHAAQAPRRVRAP